MSLSKEIILLGGILVIFTLGVILMLARRIKSRNSEQAKDALKFGTIYTISFIVIYVFIYFIINYIVAQ